MPPTIPLLRPTTTAPPPTIALSPPSSSPPPTTTIAAPPPAATLRATTRDGATSGPAGVGLIVTGANYPCGRVTIEFSGERIGQATTGAGGFRDAELTAPGDAKPGRHTVDASCGDIRLASATFTITDQSVHRPALVTELPTPAQVSFAPSDLAKSAAAVLVVIPVIFFPFALIEEVISENYDEIRGWFGFKGTVRHRTGWLAFAQFLAFAALTASVYTGLQPRFGFNFATGVTFAGLFAAVCLVVLAEGVPTLIVARRHKMDTHLQALLGSLFVAVVVVAVSRLVHIHPGYAFGAVAGFSLAGELERRAQGKLAATSILAILALALTAWVAWLPVERIASSNHPSAAIILLESVLVTTFMAGLETCIIITLPVRFVHGSDVAAWNRWVWAGLFALVAFPFIHIVVGNGTQVLGPNGASPLVMIVVSAAFAVFTVAFWGYFRFRPQREDASAVAEAGA